LPDHVIISEPKQEDEIAQPYSDVKGSKQAEPQLAGQQQA
jgi:hypothetical protein